MIEIRSVINQPITSVTYLLFDLEKSNKCLIIDPGSKDSQDLINYIEELGLVPEYIILTHEHFDHIWGVNSIINKYNCKIVASEKCVEKIRIPRNYFNLLYFGDDTPYSIENVDIIIQDGNKLDWNGKIIKFLITPGHSSCGICFSIDNMLFTGDTLMKGFKPVILKRHEGSWKDLEESINRIYDEFDPYILVYPGHGSPFALREVKEEIRKYIEASKTP